jgi:chemotaxis protein methyltransferase CheR
MGGRFERPADPHLRQEEYRALSELIATRTGLAFGPEAIGTLERRLRERVLSLRLASFHDYVHYLRFHPLAASEWDECVDALTTNETYFYRESYQLRSFQNEVLPLLKAAAAGKRRICLWSAGCATGEEAYTLAMLAAESGLFDDGQVRIVGSDLSRRCIATARAGVYGSASFRVLPEGLRLKYFTAAPGGLRVSPQLTAMCHFGQLNLLDHERARLLGRMDAVFCRNVLIYLDSASRRRVIEMFHERLYPGGVLCLGHSESLLNVSTAFQLLHLREDLVYQKPAVHREPPPRP